MIKFLICVNKGTNLIALYKKAAGDPFIVLVLHHRQTYTFH